MEMYSFDMCPHLTCKVGCPYKVEGKCVVRGTGNTDSVIATVNNETSRSPWTIERAIKEARA